MILSPEEQAVMDRGEASRFLLSTPLFIEAIDAIRKECAEVILTSAPDAKERREDTYHLSRALTAVTMQLQTYQAEADTIAIRLERLNETTESTDERE